MFNASFAGIYFLSHRPDLISCYLKPCLAGRLKLETQSNILCVDNVKLTKSQTIIHEHVTAYLLYLGF